MVQHNNIKNSIIIKYSNNKIFDKFLDYENIKLDVLDDKHCIICKSKFTSKIVKCENNHCFDLDCILQWYNQQNKSCPFCFKNINIFKVYKII